MPTLVINGKRVTVGPEFMQLPKEQQDATVDEIASSMGAQPAAPQAPQYPSIPTDMVSRLRQVQGLPQEMQPATPRPQPVDVARDLQIGAQGVGAGVANTLGLPVDLAAGAGNLAARAAGYEAPFKNPAFGSEWIKQGAGAAATAVGLPPIDQSQMSPQQRAGYNISDLGTQAAIPGALLAKGAAPISAAAERAVMAPETATTLDRAARYVQPIAKGYEANPASTFAGDIASGVGGGAALTTAQDYAPDSPLIQAGATFLGGVGAPLLKQVVEGLGGMAVNAFRGSRAPELRTLDPATGQPFTRSVADEVAGKVQQFARQGGDDPAALATQLRDRATDAMANREVPPTMGTATDNRGLLTLERGVRVQDPVAAGRYNDSVGNSVSQNIGGLRDPNADPQAAREFAGAVDSTLRREARTGADVRTNAAADQVAQAEIAQQQALQEAGRVADSLPRDPIPASQRIDQAFLDAEREARTQRQRLFRNPTLEQAQVPPDRAVAGAQAAMRDVTATTAPESIPAGMVGRINNAAAAPQQIDDLEATMARFLGQTPDAAAQPTLTMAQVMDLRSQASKGVRDASTANDGALASRYSRIRDSLNGYIEDVANGNGPAAQAARAALDFERTNYGPRFKEGPAGAFRDAVRSDPDRKNVLPSQTAGRFLNSPEGAQSLNRAAPATAADAREWMTAQLAKSGVLADQGGVPILRPDALASWGRRNASLIDAVPGFRQQFDTLVQQAQRGDQQAQAMAGRVRQAQTNFRTEEAAAGRSVQDVEKSLNEGAFATLVNQEPKLAAGSIFQSKDPIQGVREINALVANNPQAKAGWKAAVVDHLTETVTNTRRNDEGFEVSAAKLAKEFKSREQVLAEVFTPQEMNQLRRQHMILDELSRLGKGAVPGSQTAENIQSKALASVKKVLEVSLRSVMGAVQGGSEMRRINLFLDALPNNKDAVDELMKQATYNPDLASYLLSREIPGAKGAAYSGTLNKLRAAGVGAREEND